MDKKKRNILFIVYIVNFIVLLIRFLLPFIFKGNTVHYYYGAYFWIINLIEVIILSINLKRINKKNILILLTITRRVLC